MRYVIVGDGAAGTTAAYYIRQSNPLASITIVTDDPNPAYYRAALTNYLMGELRESQLFAVPPNFYIENKIERALARVVMVNASSNRIVLADGRLIEYDQLMIASGSRPNSPSFPGSELSGVMTMRTLQDVRAVMDGIRSNRIKQAVVVGGGPLGIEWVQGLMRYKVRVTYLLRGDMFFERALDRTASDLVISRLRSEGVDVRLNEEIEEALGDRNNRLRAVRLKNSKQTIECQLVGAAIGIRPNVEFLQGSGIKIAHDEKRGTPLGVIVDEFMRTNIPNIYAGGDVIYKTLGLWEPARLQGRVAGINMTGGSATYHPGAHYNATRLYDLDFASVGSLDEQPGDQVLIDFPRGGGRIAYRKLIVRGNKLVGALMLGQRKERIRKNGLQYKKLIDAGVDITPVKERLLDPAFDLPSWIDSLDLGKQIEAARSIIMTSALPASAYIRKSEKVGSSKTMLLKPIQIAPAVLRMNGQTISLENLVKIGRQPGNQIVLDDPLVSKQHAQIELQEGIYILTDTNSTNGTFLNDMRITDPRALKDGDIIRIGNTTLRFELQPAGSATGTSNLPEEIVVEQVPLETVLGVLEYRGQRHEIRSETITLGRDPEATITIEDPTVSFMHAEISRHGNHLYLRDLGSRNGTFVNGNLLATPCILKNGDMIRIGKTELKFYSTSDVPVPQSAPASLVSQVLPKEPEEEKYGQLVVRSGHTPGLTFALKPPSVIIGRGPAPNTIDLNNQTVSRKHARLEWRKDKWMLVDLQSTNGTFLNGKRLQAEVETELKAGDEVQFGDVTLIFESTVLPSQVIPQPADASGKQRESEVPSPPEQPATVSLTAMISPPPPPFEEPPAPEEESQAPVTTEPPPDAPPAPPIEPVSAIPPEAADIASAPAAEATQFFQPSFPTRLVILSGPRVGQIIKLVNLPIVLGRVATPNVQGLEDALVSRQHLEVILMTDGNIGVKDLGSVNGTQLNGEPLEPNKVVPIKKGDELRLGNTVLRAE